jgi:hypothetical protein
MKKYLSAFALAGLISVTGCDAGDDTFVDDPVLEETTPPPIVNEPITTPPPMTEPMPMDTAADTAAVAPTTPAP